MPQTENPTQLYEGMYIINGALTDDARTKTFERISTGITERGGEIQKVHDRGKQRLAYAINGQKEGHYFLAYFTAPTAAVKDLWHEWRLNENLLRFTTLRAEAVLEELTFKQLVEVQ